MTKEDKYPNTGTEYIREMIKKIKFGGIIVFLLYILYFLPYIIFGKNSIVTIHDQLDVGIPMFKMFRENGLFSKFNVPAKGFDEMSTLFFPGINYSFPSLLFFLFPDFIAYSALSVFSILFGFFSMRFLLKTIFGKCTTILLSVAVMYSLLPVVFGSISIGVNTLPLIIAFFILFFKSKEFTFKSLFLIVFPFFSNFTLVGIFVLGFWFLATITLGIKNKRLNINLLVGFIVLCAGYILVDLRLFYIMFVIKEPLNRSVFDIYPHGFIAMLKTFLITFKDYGVNGYYHATSMQRRIILPIAFFVSVSLFILILIGINKENGKLMDRIRIVFGRLDSKIKLLLILEILIFFFAGITGFYESGLLNKFIKRFIPIIAGFNWGRVWIFNRILWYLVFVLCIYLVLQIKNIVFSFNESKEQFIITPTIIKCTVYITIGFQLCYILLSPVYYNDLPKTWFNEIVLKTGIAGKVWPNKSFDDYISYKEFFSEEFFDEIKKNISYSDEKTVALGFHPSVLMYNGFNCIDGYNNAYPLSYMKKFRTLIAPELEVNKEMRDYYDSWGGRMYLYNSELSFGPTRNKNTSPVKLNIDIDVFKNDFDGKYILSRAAISNSDFLGLDFVKKYDHNDSIYTIYLYAVN